MASHGPWSGPFSVETAHVMTCTSVLCLSGMPFSSATECCARSSSRVQRGGAAGREVERDAASPAHLLRCADANAGEHPQVRHLPEIRRAFASLLSSVANSAAPSTDRVAREGLQRSALTLRKATTPGRHCTALLWLRAPLPRLRCERKRPKTRSSGQS